MDFGNDGRVSGPRVGLDDDTAPTYPSDLSSLGRGASPPPARSSGRTFVAALLLVSLTLAALAGGFIVGEQSARRRALASEDWAARAHDSACLRALGQGLSQVQQELASLAATAGPIARSEAASLAELRTIAAGLDERLKLAGTPPPAWESVAPQLERIAALLSKLESSKISVIEELCPASPRTPETYTKNSGSPKSPHTP